MRFNESQRAARLLLAWTCLAAVAQPIPEGTDLGGRQVPLLSLRQRTAVLFFIASDCPISNRYEPEMQRIRDEYSPRGVAVWFVYPNLTETAMTIANHQTAFTAAGKTSQVLIDPRRQLVQVTGANVTPEAAILAIDLHGALHTVYAGRIDDRYLSIGNERPRATHHDLEVALKAALAGDAVPRPGGPPVGCGIVSTR